MPVACLEGPDAPDQRQTPDALLADGEVGDDDGRTPPVEEAERVDDGGRLVDRLDADILHQGANHLEDDGVTVRDEHARRRASNGAAGCAA